MAKTKHESPEVRSNGRSPWTRPSLRRLATSEAELSPTTVHADSEGFIS
ncbi:MAG: hypothetical protein QOK17_1891 [Sphingomonadales bacterium]|jgi:hypothetical protein|nr:hypothetical protein [Sphingomonadales bacterium]